MKQTLYHYLENGSNVHKTARAMNFSISGLRYRLGRLNEILQLDINTPYIRHEIYLALQVLNRFGRTRDRLSERLLGLKRNINENGGFSMVMVCKDHVTKGLTRTTCSTCERNSQK